VSLRIVTAGESHGPGLTTIVEGLPAGLPLEQEAVNADMARRQLGHGRGGRMKIEKDTAEITAGVRHGRTLGGPVALQVANRDFANWEERMNPWPVEADVPEVHLPRPGHADLAGVWKYGPGEPEARLAEVQRDLSGLVALARAVNMTVAIRNVAGDSVGASIWDANMLIRGMDPRTVGFAYDAGEAVAEGGGGGWLTALQLALPRIKMVVARDFVWEKAPGGWKRTPCPLGERMVDWGKLFEALARVRFTGPISLPVDYQPKDEISAIHRDVEFIRKRVAAAYA